MNAAPRLLSLYIGMCALVFTVAYAQTTSENNERLKKALAQHPEADAKGDGVLTMQEARAALREIMETDGADAATSPGAVSKSGASQTRDSLTSGSKTSAAKAGAQAKRKAKKMDQTVTVPPGLEPTYANVKYGPYERNVLDFWKAKSDKPTPLVVFIHGGGFVAGSKEKAFQTPQVIRRCLDSGVSFAAINYRYRSATLGVQDVMRDSARAIQFMRSKAGEWNIDKTRVASYGGSAGAGTSLWLGFHDDLADPKSTDTVLRESSRLAVLGANACQCTYDIVRWKEILGEGPADDRAGAPGAFYGLKEGEDLESPKAKQIRADVDMLGLLTKGDPPVYLYSKLPNTPPTDRGHYVHHPKHAIAIKEKCDQLGIENVLILSDTPLPEGKKPDDVMLDFFFKHLGVSATK